MCVRPRPEMRSPATRQSGRAISQRAIQPNHSTPSFPIDQALTAQTTHLRRLYALTLDTASTIATLAYAVTR
jgi:hypothetical protein